MIIHTRPNCESNKYVHIILYIYDVIDHVNMRIYGIQWIPRSQLDDLNFADDLALPLLAMNRFQRKRSN